MKDYWDALVELVTLPYPRVALHKIAREFSVWSSITAALAGVSLLSVVWAVVPLLSADRSKVSEGNSAALFLTIPLLAINACMAHFIAFPMSLFRGSLATSQTQQSSGATDDIILKTSPAERPQRGALKSLFCAFCWIQGIASLLSCVLPVTYSMSTPLPVWWWIQMFINYGFMVRLNILAIKDIYAMSFWSAVVVWVALHLVWAAISAVLKMVSP